MNDRKIIRFCLNDEILIEELDKLEYEGRDINNVVKEALAVYLLDESEDNRLTVKKK